MGRREFFFGLFISLILNTKCAYEYNQDTLIAEIKQALQVESEELDPSWQELSDDYGKKEQIVFTQAIRTVFHAMVTIHTPEKHWLVSLAEKLTKTETPTQVARINYAKIKDVLKKHQFKKTIQTLIFSDDFHLGHCQSFKELLIQDKEEKLEEALSKEIIRPIRECFTIERGTLQRTYQIESVSIEENAIAHIMDIVFLTLKETVEKKS